MIELSQNHSMDKKLQTNVDTASVHSPDFSYEDGLQPQKGSTRGDVLDMSRMGKKQELQVSANAESP